MDNQFGLQVVEDDDLHGRAVPESYRLEDEDDQYGCLAD